MSGVTHHLFGMVSRESEGLPTDRASIVHQALRVSLEEERERARKAGELEGGAADGGAATAPAAAPESDMDADLRAAMAMSMGDAMQVDPGTAGAGDVSAMTEEEMIARAMAMSMAGVEDSGGSAAMEVEGTAEAQVDPTQMLQDPSFLSDVLSGLEGVDPDDAEIREAVSDLASKVEKKDGDEGGGK